jgi:hypothetical protein
MKALLVAVVLASMVAALWSAGPGGAGNPCTIEVNATDDNLVIDGNVSLREAISFAVDDFDPFPVEQGQIEDCPGDNPGAFTADFIEFDPAMFPFATPGTISLMGGLPALHTGNDIISGLFQGVIVDGNGAGVCFRLTSDNNQILNIRIKNCGVAILVAGQGPAIPIRQATPQGGVAPAEGNTIVYNQIGSSEIGIQLDDGANNTVVSANNIGTNFTGDATDPNGTGVLVTGGTGNRIGGSDGIAMREAKPSGVGPNYGNVISGNTEEGVRIEGGSGSLVLGNYIGTNLPGDAALPNGSHGVEIVNSPGNVIGSPVGDGGNVISGNGGEGVKIHGDASAGNSVAANHIGVNKDGTAEIGNANSGIYVIHSTDTTIGGTTANERNVISGNHGFAGIAICGNPVFCGGEDMDSGTGDASGTQVMGNYVGTDVSGNGAIPNAGSGVTVDGASNVVIGGLAPAAGNVLSGNGSGGLALFSGTNNSLVASNHIGVSESGMSAVPNLDGIYLDSAPFNQIGQAGAGNVISGNLGTGLVMFGEEAADNTIQANLIGVGSDGGTPLGNGFGGIYAAGTGPNVIGGDGNGEGNVIAHNQEWGIGIDLIPPVSVSKRISANSIHSNDGLGIDLETDGVTQNDNKDPDMGGNALQNFPNLNEATVGGGTHVEGTLNSTPNTAFRVEFFANDACDPSGNGEGQTYLGFANTMTDAEGNAEFSTDVDAAAAGDQITATATDPADNTSEFSQCLEAEQGEGTPTPTPSQTPTPTPTATPQPGAILGDTDCDEDADAVDALNVLEDVAGLDANAECLAQGGDVQCDGDIDALDALGILIFQAALPPQPQEPDCVPVGDPIA